MTEAYLVSLIPQIATDFMEVYAHPALAIAGESVNGPPDGGEAELTALLSDTVRAALTANGFALTNYHEWEALVRQ
jgi:hypothetical protein